MIACLIPNEIDRVELWRTGRDPVPMTLQLTADRHPKDGRHFGNSFVLVQGQVTLLTLGKLFAGSKRTTCWDSIPAGLQNGIS